MKGFFLTIIGSFVMAGSILGQTAGPGYSITGKITGKDTGTAYLINPDEAVAHIDSARLTRGVFSFRGKVSSPMLYTLRISGGKNRQKAFFLENSRIRITADCDSLYKADISGSATNAQFDAFWKDWGKVVHQPAGVVYKLEDSASAHGKKEVPPEIKELITAKFKAIAQANDSLICSFIKKHPQSPVGPFIIIDRFINYSDEGMVAKTYALLAKDARDSYYGKKIAEHVATAAKTAVGSMPQLSLPDTSGKILRLADLKGKYVLVDFWASWCGPCRKENPNVVAAYRKYHDKGLEIIGVSLDNNKERWEAAVKKDTLDWYHVSDLKGWKSDPVLFFGIKSIPFNFLVDRNGKIIAKNLRGEALDNKLNAIL